MNYNVSQHLALRAQEQPDFCAVKLPRGRSGSGEIVYEELSFAQLEQMSNRLALYLQSRGVRRGTSVLLMVKPGRDLILLTFALFKLAAVPTVIDPGMGLSSFLTCVQRTQPEVLVGIPLAIGLSRLFSRRFKSVRERIGVGRGWQRHWQGNTDVFEAVATTKDELAAILFTSGSTGFPKGVCYQHGMFAAQVEAVREAYAIEPGEVDLPMLPIFALFNPALGMTTVVPEMNPSKPATVDPAKVVQAMVQNGVTSSFGSPVLWRKIGEYCMQKNITFPRMKRILMAGAPVPVDVLRMYQQIIPHGQVHTPYGATECLPIASMSGEEILGDTWPQTEQGHGTCVGRAVASAQLRIIPDVAEVIADIGEVDFLEAGQVGEIVVQADVVTRSYHRLAEATALAKIADAGSGGLWHRMGDLGYLDGQGRLWFCGRKAEKVVVGEQVYYTDCCEAIFNGLVGVRRTALIAWRDRAAMVVELEEGSRRSVVLERLREEAQRHEWTGDIAGFFFAKTFPVDVRHNAKIHRLRLAKQFSSQECL